MDFSPKFFSYNLTFVFTTFAWIFPGMSKNSFVGIWTYALTFDTRNYYTTDTKEETVEVYMECSKKSENNLQCRLPGDSEANPTNYNILDSRTIELAENSQFRGTYVAEYGIIVWHKNGILIDHTWTKKGIPTRFYYGESIVIFYETFYLYTNEYYHSSKQRHVVVG